MVHRAGAVPGEGPSTVGHSKSKAVKTGTKQTTAWGARVLELLRLGRLQLLGTLAIIKLLFEQVHTDFEIGNCLHRLKHERLEIDIPCFQHVD